MAYILITGASSGIGKTFALAFAKKGFDLILVARREDKLNEVKQEIKDNYNSDVIVLSLDISKYENIEYLYNYINDNNIEVSCLINNAGFGQYGKFEDIPLEKYQQMIDLNNKSLVSLSYLFVHYFKENGYGLIVNIASIAGFMPGPYMAVYYASKAFVLSFSQALRQELKKDNINVIAICPGPIDTQFWAYANVSMSNFKKKYLARDVNDLVDGSIKAIENKQDVYVDGILYKVSAKLVKILPRKLVCKVCGQVNKSLNK